MSRHVKICHTSDWHLGHTLHGHDRAYEHGCFLGFLLDVLEREEVDALVVAGDIFHTANPPAAAQSQLYSFFAEARARMPKLDVLLIAGNHDSAARLGAADPILRHIGVRVVGPVPREGRGGRAPVRVDELVVPLCDRGGEVAAWVAAVPFLRPSDLPVADAVEGGDSLVDPLIEGVRRVYDGVLGAARAKRKPDQALLATGHCHMVAATPSELSERRILGGPQHALPTDLFPDDVSYVALGHLHLPQAVGEHGHIRYSGSPIPLSMPEESYPHQLRIVRFEGGQLAEQREVRIPRAVDVLRIPGDGPGSLEDVLGQLAQLELPAVDNKARWPFLEVRVQLDSPVPDLRHRIEQAVFGSGEGAAQAVRLVKIGVTHTHRGAALAESAPRRELGDLSVDDVFKRAFERKFEGQPDKALMRAFHEVAEAARRQLEGGSG
ncbi:MAG: exonuclease SbcCD subunit D C-terminal domain-containing protein [Sandaracinaceae bacterium]